MATNRKPAAVSMDPELYDRAKKRARDLGFATFSAYVVQLIRADIIGGGAIAVHEEAAAYQVKKPDLRNAAHSPPTVPSAARS